MDINIAPIKNYEGKEIPINCEVNIAGMPGDDFKILEPVKILGVIRNFGGTFELEAKGTAKLQFVCDRCAEEFSSEMNFNISERKSKSGYKLLIRRYNFAGRVCLFKYGS